MMLTGQQLHLPQDIIEEVALGVEFEALVNLIKE